MNEPLFSFIYMYSILSVLFSCICQGWHPAHGQRGAYDT